MWAPRGCFKNGAIQDSLSDFSFKASIICVILSSNATSCWKKDVWLTNIVQGDCFSYWHIGYSAFSFLGWKSCWQKGPPECCHCMFLISSFSKVTYPGTGTGTIAFVCQQLGADLNDAMFSLPRCPLHCLMFSRQLWFAKLRPKSCDHQAGLLLVQPLRSLFLWCFGGASLVALRRCSIQEVVTQAFRDEPCTGFWEVRCWSYSTACAGLKEKEQAQDNARDNANTLIYIYKGIHIGIEKNIQFCTDQDRESWQRL